MKFRSKRTHRPDSMVFLLLFVVLGMLITTLIQVGVFSA